MNLLDKYRKILGSNPKSLAGNARSQNPYKYGNKFWKGAGGDFLVGAQNAPKRALNSIDNFLTKKNMLYPKSIRGSNLNKQNLSTHQQKNPSFDMKLATSRVGRSTNQYALNNIILPFSQGVRTIADPKSSKLDKGLGGLGVAAGVFQSLPGAQVPSMVFDTVLGAAHGATKTMTQGGSFLKNTERAINTPEGLSSYLGWQDKTVRIGDEDIPVAPFIDIAALIVFSAGYNKTEKSLALKRALKIIEENPARTAEVIEQVVKRFPKDFKDLSKFSKEMNTWGKNTPVGVDNIVKRFVSNNGKLKTSKVHKDGWFHLKSDISTVAVKETPEAIHLRYIRGGNKKGESTRLVAEMVDYADSNGKVFVGEQVYQGGDYWKRLGTDVVKTDKGYEFIIDADNIDQFKNSELYRRYVTDTKIEAPKKIITKGSGVVPVEAKGAEVDFDARKYVDEQVKLQSKASKGKNKPSFWQQVKTAFSDSTSPIGDTLDAAEKEGRYKIRPQKDIRYQIDRVLGSESLGDVYARENGLDRIIQDVDDMSSFEQYLIAKRNIKLTGDNIETGRNLAKDKMLVDSLSTKYEGTAQDVYKYNKDLLNYMVEEGLISPSLRNSLIKENPEYIPFKRIFGEGELTAPTSSKGKQVSSLAQQTVVQRIKGSTREVESPLFNVVENTKQAVNQAEKNKAARMLADYRNLPGNPFNIKEIGKSTPLGNRHTISYLDGGNKVSFEVPADIEAAAKSLDKQQINSVLKVVSYFTRTLRLGATSLNIPFVVTNLLKDQQLAFIASTEAGKTSLLNPENFLKSLWSAVGHDELYDNVVKHSGMQTSFDIGRESPKMTLDKIRSGKDASSKIKYLVTHPKELLRALEDIIGRSEELTRIQQFGGTREAAVARGMSEETADIIAAAAARENTANFRRSGNIGKVVNWFIPFFNAGIQGSKTLVRAFAKNPQATSAKFAVSFAMPQAAATYWNLSDPQRKIAYMDINEYEKENNFIIVPNNPSKDEQGRWNVIKIPVSPGLGNLLSIERRVIESTQDMDPLAFQDIAGNFFTAATSIEHDPAKLVGQLTPQIIKGGVETSVNKNLFTGKEIVPSNMRFLPPEEQKYPWTSTTAQKIGKVTKQSPLIVENFVRTQLAGVGSQLINLSDTILSKTTNQDVVIGGENPIQNIQRRFTKASGGRALEETRAQETAGFSPKETALYDLLQTYSKNDDYTQPQKNWKKIGESALKLAHPEVADALNSIAIQKALINSDPINPYNELTDKQRTIVDTINALPPASTDKKTLQKQNLGWLKPYWEANTNYFAYIAAKNDDASNKKTQSNYYKNSPQASKRAQALMDAGNFSDPEVKTYLAARAEYNNSIRAAMGLPATGGYGGYGGKSSGLKYIDVTLPKVKMKKLSPYSPPKNIRVQKSRSYRTAKLSKYKPVRIVLPKTPTGAIKVVGKIKLN